MYKPPKDVALKTYAPTNPEYGLVDLMVSEAFAAVSPEIYYWSFDAETTEQDMDEVDQIYVEKSSSKFLSRQNIINKLNNLSILFILLKSF